MKPRINLIVLVLCIFSSVNSQNKIRNNSFESGDYDEQAFPYENYIENIDYWDHDAYIPSGYAETWHSPDWFDQYGYQGYAYDGTKFVGIYEFEVIEQELTGSYELEAGKFYLFSCFIQLFYEYDEANDLNQYEDYDLKFYLSKNRIRYKSHLIDDFCSSDYKKVTNNKIKTIKQFELDPLPNEEWLELKFLYVVLDEIEDYNWFGIELVSDQSLNCKDAYILIDNVSIIEVDYCSLESCLRTTGSPIASAPFHYHSPNGPIAVDFLENIETASNIAIYNIVPGTKVKDIPNVHSVNGIYNPIFWDGRNSAGIPVAPGGYVWTMDLTNDCTTFPYAETFIKLYEVLDPIPSSPDYSTIRTPSPCCSDEEDILIDYDITGNGKIEFIAIDDIILQNMSVENSVDDLYLQAGNSIVFEPGVSILSGSLLKAKIYPCYNDNFIEEEGPLKSGHSQINLINNPIKEGSEKETINAELGELEIDIYPNPTDGILIVELKNILEGLTPTIIVYDMNAKIIIKQNITKESINIDFSGRPPGMYNLIISVGDLMGRWKIIKR